MCGFFRVVKLSSPNLNYIIIAGVALLYVSVFLYTISSQETLPQTLLCNVCAHVMCVQHILFMCTSL